MDSPWHKFYLVRFQPTIMVIFISLFSEAENILSFQCNTPPSLPRRLTFWGYIHSHQSFTEIACLLADSLSASFKIKVNKVGNSSKNRTSRIRECLIVWFILPKMEVISGLKKFYLNRSEIYLTSKRLTKWLCHYSTRYPYANMQEVQIHKLSSTGIIKFQAPDRVC